MVLLRIFSTIRATAYTSALTKVKDTKAVFLSRGQTGLLFAVGIDQGYRNSLSDILEAIEKARDDKKILMLYAHIPKEEDGQYYVRPSTLEAICKKVVELNLRFFRVSEI